MIGLWDDNHENKANHGNPTNITANLWGNNTIKECDNVDNWAIVRRPNDTDHNPNTYSKLVWKDIDQDNSSFWYCEIAYNLTSLKNASDWKIDKVCSLLFGKWVAE